MLGSIALLAFGAIACGPSPAYAPPRSAARPPPRAVVVEACPSDDADDADDDAADEHAPPRKPVEYVRLDEWVPPPSVRETESHIEPRGNKPPDYIHLPKLTMHRSIPTGYGWGGRYWR